MAGIPGLDVYEIFEPEPGRAVSLRPGSTAQRVPNTAIATRPYQPNWTVPPPAAPAALPAPGLKTMTPDMTSANAARARAAAARAPSAPAPVAPSTPAGNVVQRAWRGLRAGAQEAGKASVSAGRVLARGSLPALAGAGLAMADDALEANRPAAEPFVAPPAQPGDIPIDTSLRAPAATPEPSPLGFGPNNEFTRNLAAAANAFPGVGPVMNASARTAATAARAFGGIETGRRTAQALTGAQAAQQVVRGAQAAQGAPEALPALSMGELPQADYSNEGNNYPTMRTAPPVNPNGTIIRDGNSYSGEPGIKFGADIANKDGSLRTGGGTVSSLDTSEGFRQNLLELERNAAARAAAAPQGPMLDGLRGRKADRAVTQYINDQNNATSRQNNERTVSAALRGQDITDKGNLLQADAAAKRLRLEGAQKERDFQTDQANKEFAQRGTREAEMQKNIESRTMRPDKNGAPQVDPVAARRYREGIDRSVAALGTSIDKLGPRATEQLFAASDLLKAIRDKDEWFGPEVNTIIPADLVGLQIDPKTGNGVSRRKDRNGKPFVIPARFLQTEEASRFFSLFDTPTNKFDVLQAPD